MNTYYLWAINEGINIGPAIENGFESAFVVRVKKNGFEAAMKELAELAQRNGKKRHLEIHCHGLPAKLLLGANNAVTNYNVRAFGIALRQVLLPGGLIELLACLVAFQGDPYRGDVRKLCAAPQAQIQGYREDYHGVIRRRKTITYFGSGASGNQEMLPDGAFIERKHPIKDDPNVFFTPVFETDGLKFCLDLAASSGCTVRAAIIQQREEGGSGMLDSPIGNWECEVFDFNPNDTIKFLGASPYRGLMINSFDMDQFPQA